MTEDQRFRLHLGTAIGLVLLIALLVHLNFAPLAIDLGGNRIVIRYGWPLRIGENEPQARAAFDILVALALPVLFYRVCEACAEWIHWSAAAIVEATRRARAARKMLARLKIARHEARNP